MGCNASKVISKEKNTKPSPKQVKKHIFFAYAEEDASDRMIAEALKNHFTQRRFRVYQPGKTENINEKIANGIENAAIILVFPSATLETSKTGSKLLNYADQTKTPILIINIYENFQPKGWLGAILAPKMSCSTSFDAVLESLNALGINTKQLIRERNEEVESNSREEYLFYGDSKSGNMNASYHYSGEDFPMKFKFFGLKSGKVYGEGDDDVGAFTFAGQYQIEDNSGDIIMSKQYVGQHLITYTGRISLKAVTIMVEGYWNIGEMTDKFSMILTLSKPYTAEKYNIPSPPVTTRQGTKVMISYCPCQYDLAQKITEGLLSRDIPAICPPMRMHDMLKIAAQDARVVIPLMSDAYEASNTAKYVLSYVDEVGIPIVPIKTQDRYTQSGWLGVICAGALYIRMTNNSDLDRKFDDLVKQLRLYIDGSVNEKNQTVDILVDESCPQGYYVQWGQKFEMTFNMFTLVNGNIAGEGQDCIGGFIIHGHYVRSPNRSDFPFQFTKHYIGQHDVNYSGNITKHGSQLFFDGKWVISSLSDSFHLEVMSNQSSGSKNRHIMLSYQWKNQELVKKMAGMLREMNIPIWFDIAGDMKGNINNAMANGVEGAAVIVCFVTVAYTTSVNCQKEFTYARQLKKNIFPVLLEHEDNINDTWLGVLLTSLNKVKLKDESQINSCFNQLVKYINGVLEQKESETSLQSHVVTRFEGNTVTGRYYQFGRAFDMIFDFFSLREGRVTGQGNDFVGPFTMAGSYDNDGNTCFIKQYVGQHAVEYEGKLDCNQLGGFKIQGEWKIQTQTDDFSLEGELEKDKMKVSE